MSPCFLCLQLLVNVEDEKDLDLSKLDTTVYLHDLPPEEQATIDQLRYDQECKIKGLSSRVLVFYPLVYWEGKHFSSW